MKKYSAVILFALALCMVTVLPVYAKPTDEAARAFDEGIFTERRNFEAQLRATPPGERTQEIRRFNSQTAEEKIAFDQSIAGLPLADKNAAIDDYIARRHDQLVEHNNKLKNLSPEKNNLQAKRKEFDKQTAQKIKDFYGQ